MKNHEAKIQCLYFIWFYSCNGVPGCTYCMLYVGESGVKGNWGRLKVVYA